MSTIEHNIVDEFLLAYQADDQLLIQQYQHLCTLSEPVRNALLGYRSSLELVRDSHKRQYWNDLVQRIANLITEEEHCQLVVILQNIQPDELNIQNVQVFFRMAGIALDCNEAA